MSFWQALVIALAGVGAGTINAVVGSGTLLTFPTLLFFGYPPVVANISNNVGLVAGGLSGSIGYRREMAGAGPFLRRHLPPALLGGVLGAVLLLVLPARAFGAVVPVLVVLGIVLVLAGPRINAAAARLHHDDTGAGPEVTVGWRGWATLVGVFLAGVYGGYFGAAQGVIVLGLLSALTTIPLQSINGRKNVLVTSVNFVAALVFLVAAPGRIDWAVAGLVALGATVGGFVGASVGRRLPPMALRVVVALVGLAALVRLVFWS